MLLVPERVMGQFINTKNITRIGVRAYVSQ